MENKAKGLLLSTGIILIVIGFLLLVDALIVGSLLSAFLLIISVLYIILGVYFINRSSVSAEEIMHSNNVILVWSIILFIFGGIILGIFSLLAYLKIQDMKDYINPQETENLRSSYYEITKNSSNTSENKENLIKTNLPIKNNVNTDFENSIFQLKQLAELRDKNIISQEEFENLKSSILKDKIN